MTSPDRHPKPENGGGAISLSLWLSLSPVIGFYNVVEGGLLLILSAFLEDGELMFNGVQIWGIGREEQQGCACLGDEPRCCP